MTEHPRDHDYDEYDDDYEQGGRRKKRGLPGCLAVLVALALIAGLGWFALSKGGDLLDRALDSGGGDDYPGPGTGKVTFQVKEGDSVAQIGRNLKAQGVTKSVDAFINAAQADEASSGIQVGYYGLKKEMKASDALAVLVDPDNLMIASVTVPEGLRVVDTIALLAKKTDFTKKQLNKALRGDIGLPAYANGNPEGYLFPSTYELGPEDTAQDLLRSMVDRWATTAEEAGLEQKAADLGHTPSELMIIASLVEAEGRGDDMGKIARVIYNRLDGPGDKGGTYGYLQIDASNAYGLGKSGTTALTSEELAVPSPYNTRTTGGQPGLPPTPIEAPGAEAIEAAANPAEGDWYYYVTVNLATGETKFYEDYDGFLEGKREYEQYCATQSDRC